LIRDDADAGKTLRGRVQELFDTTVVEASPAVVRVPKPMEAIVTAQETKAGILRVLGAAHKRLFVSTHAIGDADYEAALVKAADGGARVMILLSDPKYAGYSSAARERIRARLAELASHPNITVLDFPNRRLQFGTNALMPEFHGKLYLADDTVGYLGDANLYIHDNTLSAGVLVHGEEVKQLQWLALRAWTEAGGKLEDVDKEFLAKIPDKDFRQADDAKVKILTSRFADRNIKQEILRDIANAEKEVFLVQYYLGDKDVFDGLKSLKQKKPSVDVHVLLGRRHQTLKVGGKEVRLPFNLFAYRELSKAGIDARFVDDAHFVHGKMALIDRRVAHLGSADWYYRGLEGNFEINARLDAPEVAEKYLGQYEKFFADGTTHELSTWDNASTSLADVLGHSATRLAGSVSKLFHASRAFSFSDAFMAKFLRISARAIQRFANPKEFPPVELRRIADLGTLKKQIQTQFDIESETQLGTPGKGIALVAGHTQDRTDVVATLGVQPSFNGDIGPGIYLTNDTRIAQEYAVIHGEKGRANLVVYQADIEKPFRLPEQKEEYAKWLAGRPQHVKRSFWDQLPVYCREHGYDSAILEHFEGLDNHYFLVFDRDRVRPVTSFTVKPRQARGWTSVAGAELAKKVGRGQAARPSGDNLGALAEPVIETEAMRAEIVQGGGQGVDSIEYRETALEVMRAERGLTTTDTLNPEIGLLGKHVVYKITPRTAKAGDEPVFFRMIENYGINYPGIFSDAYKQWKDRPLAGISLYSRKLESQYEPEVVRTAIAAAKSYFAQTGAPQGLYLEVRDDQLAFYEKFGFRSIGAPFKARAWTGKWYPMILDLQAPRADVLPSQLEAPSPII
jgi:phosphatidylserine/phosphatidylglycerophosphate/cardiolipin synthase-like enzyme